MRKLIGMMIVMFICFAMATGSAFAVPPEDRASKNQACHASDTAKKKANEENSVVSNAPECPEPSSTDDGTTDDLGSTDDSESADDPESTCDLLMDPSC